MPETPTELEALERWMLELISHPEGFSEALQPSGSARQALPAVESVDELLTASPTQTAEERLSVYADAYFWRLIDILCGEFPSCQHLYGADRFAELCKVYLTVHPSSSWTLNKLGQHFPRFLRESAPPDYEHLAFAAAVATIERTMEDVFVAADTPLVAADELLAIPQEQWGQLRLVPIAGFALLALDYPANAYIQAVRDSRQMDIPDPSPSWVVVFRNEFTVWRAPLSREQYALLSALHRGLTVIEALEVCFADPLIDQQHIIENLGSWFQSWGGDGLFQAAIA